MEGFIDLLKQHYSIKYTIQIYMILDPDTHGYDAHICMLHLSMINDTCMYDAYIYVPQSLTLIYVYQMNIFVILIHVAMMYPKSRGPA